MLPRDVQSLPDDKKLYSTSKVAEKVCTVWSTARFGTRRLRKGGSGSGEGELGAARARTVVLELALFLEEGVLQTLNAGLAGRGGELRVEPRLQPRLRLGHLQRASRVKHATQRRARARGAPAGFALRSKTSSRRG